MTARTAMRRICALALAALPPVMGCAADPAPRAEIRDVSPRRIDPRDPAGDDVTLTLRYEDADGDLGGGEARVQDCRAADLASRFPIPVLAQPGAVAAGVRISGELRLRVAGIAEIAGGSPEAPPACAGAAQGAGEVVLCVTLRDLAGHEGPPACAPPIALAPSR